MRSILILVAILIIGWWGFGCASTKTGEFKKSIKRGNGELVYLICESRGSEGQTTPKKHCREPSEDEVPDADEEPLVLYCETLQLKDGAEPQRICKKQEGIECEYFAKTGSRVPKLRCMRTADKEKGTACDQKALNRILIESQ